MCYKKNDTVTVTIEDLTKDGEGIGHIDGYTLFVKDALPGDTVKAKILKPKKTYAYARLMEIIAPSKDRVSAVCPEARRCGGCRLLEYSYEAQLRWKRHYVQDVVERIGGFPDAEVLPVIGMQDPYRYRNKAQYPVSLIREHDGSMRIASGFYAGRTHSLIPVSDCFTCPEANALIMDRFLGWMRASGIMPYDESTGEGLVRHVLIRAGAKTGEIMVCPIINGFHLPYAEGLVRVLTEIPGVASICFNCNTQRGNTILGVKTVCIYGKSWIEDSIGGLSFRISARSFYQVNPVQTEILYKEAVKAASLTGGETVYDLYCGIGTISLFAARHAGSVYGVEIIGDAVRDAKENALRNGIENAFFYEGAAEELIVSGELASGVPCPRADVVILDPPRKGCAPELIRAVKKLAPDRVVYVSCDPATLARDLKLFAEENFNSYRPVRIQPVDMFPHTMHVETVVLMSRKDT